MTAPLRLSAAQRAVLVAMNENAVLYSPALLIGQQVREYWIYDERYDDDDLNHDEDVTYEILASTVNVFVRYGLIALNRETNEGSIYTITAAGRAALEVSK